MAKKLSPLDPYRESLMSDRFTVIGVAVVCLLVGIAAGFLAPHIDGIPAPSSPDDEPPEPGKLVLVFRTEPGLDSPAAVRVAGDVRAGRQWVFSFRKPDDTRRVYEAARDAAVRENRRALDWS
jgi:hypothetical protein